MYSVFATWKGISYTSSLVGKDPQQTRGFSGMPLHDTTDCKCQRVFTIFHSNTPFWNCIFNAHKPLVFMFRILLFVRCRLSKCWKFFCLIQSESYHLQEWRGPENAPTTAKEYFNMKHSFTRNVIESAFGVPKGHWAILRGKSYYPLQV